MTKSRDIRGPWRCHAQVMAKLSRSHAACAAGGARGQPRGHPTCSRGTTTALAAPASAAARRRPKQLPLAASAPGDGRRRRVCRSRQPSVALVLAAAVALVLAAAVALVLAAAGPRLLTRA